VGSGGGLAIGRDTIRASIWLVHIGDVGESWTPSLASGLVWGL
jgi:hypothetical protein